MLLLYTCREVYVRGLSRPITECFFLVECTDFVDEVNRKTSSSRDLNDPSSSSSPPVTRSRSPRGHNAGALSGVFKRITSRVCNQPFKPKDLFPNCLYELRLKMAALSGETTNGFATVRVMWAQQEMAFPMTPSAVFTEFWGMQAILLRHKELCLVQATGERTVALDTKTWADGVLSAAALKEITEIATFFVARGLGQLPMIKYTNLFLELYRLVDSIFVPLCGPDPEEARLISATAELKALEAKYPELKLSHTNFVKTAEDDVDNNNKVTERIDRKSLHLGLSSMGIKIPPKHTKPAEPVFSSALRFKDFYESESSKAVIVKVMEIVTSTKYRPGEPTHDRVWTFENLNSHINGLIHEDKPIADASPKDASPRTHLRQASISSPVKADGKKSLFHAAALRVVVEKPVIEKILVTWSNFHAELASGVALYKLQHDEVLDISEMKLEEAEEKYDGPVLLGSVKVLNDESAGASSASWAEAEVAVLKEAIEKAENANIALDKSNREKILEVEQLRRLLTETEAVAKSWREQLEGALAAEKTARAFDVQSVHLQAAVALQAALDLQSNLKEQLKKAEQDEARQLEALVEVQRQVREGQVAQAALSLQLHDARVAAETLNQLFEDSKQRTEHAHMDLVDIAASLSTVQAELYTSKETLFNTVRDKENITQDLTQQLNDALYQLTETKAEIEKVTKT
jgi:hypothetical protein